MGDFYYYCCKIKRFKLFKKKIKKIVVNSDSLNVIELINSKKRKIF